MLTLTSTGADARAADILKGISASVSLKVFPGTLDADSEPDVINTSADAISLAARPNTRDIDCDLYFSTIQARAKIPRPGMAIPTHPGRAKIPTPRLFHHLLLHELLLAVLLHNLEHRVLLHTELGM